MYFTGSVLGAPNFQFATLGSANAGKVICTNADSVFSTTISAGQLDYITGLTSQAGGVGQQNTWTDIQFHSADVSTTGSARFIQPYNAGVLEVSTLVNRATLDTAISAIPNLLTLSNTWSGAYNQFNGTVSTMGSNRFIQPYNAVSADISTLVNRATLDGAIAGLGAGILTLNNTWSGTNTFNSTITAGPEYTVNLNGGLRTLQNATQFNPTLDANSYFITGVFPTTYTFTTNWTVNPVSGTTANVALDPAVFYFDTSHKYVISFTGIYGTGASWVGTVFNNSTSLTVSDASIAITTSPQNLTMTFTAGSSNPTIYLRFVGASGTLRWTNFTIKEVDVEIMGNLTLSSDIGSNIIQSNGRTATLANGLKVNQTSVATAPTLTTASLPTGVSASTLSGSYTLTATAGGTTFGMWLGSSFTYIAGAKYTFTFTGFSTNATATQAMILYTNTYTAGSGTFIGDYIVNVPITSSTVSGFFTATSNNNVVWNFISSASGRSISFTGFTLTRADTEIPANLYAPKITTATSIAMTTAGGTLTMASNGRTTHASGDNSYTLYGPNSSWGKYLAVGATPDVGNATTAQVIGTNGDIFIDAANGQSIYYGNYQTSRGGTGTHEFYGNRFLYGNDSVIGNLTINNGTSAFIRKNGSTTGYNMTINGGTATNSPYVEFFAGGTSRGYIGNATATDLDLVAQNGAKLNFYTSGANRMTIATTGEVNVASNLTATTNLTGGSVIVNGGGSYVAGALYSDVNWGILFRARVAPSAGGGIFGWYDSAGTERMKMDATGDLFTQGRFTCGGNGSSGILNIKNPNASYTHFGWTDNVNYIRGANSLFDTTITLNSAASGLPRIRSSNDVRSLAFDDGNGLTYLLNNAGNTPISFGPGGWNTGGGGYTVVSRATGVQVSGLAFGTSTGRGVIVSLTPGVVWNELIISGSTIYTACFGTINNYTNGGGWVFVSDKRVKKDIKDIKTARSLERIMALKPKTYKKIYRQELSDTPIPQEVIDADHIGLLAQDVMETNPHCVSEWVDDNCVCDGDDGKRLGIAYGDINIHMVGAIQELKKQNDAQQKQIDDLQEMVKALMAKLI